MTELPENGKSEATRINSVQSFHQHLVGTKRIRARGASRADVAPARLSASRLIRFGPSVQELATRRLEEKRPKRPG